MESLLETQRRARRLMIAAMSMMRRRWLYILTRGARSQYWH
jgi:hypothetical protein